MRSLGRLSSGPFDRNSPLLELFDRCLGGWIVGESGVADAAENGIPSTAIKDPAADANTTMKADVSGNGIAASANNPYYYADGSYAPPPAGYAPPPADYAAPPPDGVAAPSA